MRGGSVVQFRHPNRDAEQALGQSSLVSGMEQDLKVIGV